jgi:hypothetical protein
MAVKAETEADVATAAAQSVGSARFQFCNSPVVDRQHGQVGSAERTGSWPGLRGRFRRAMRFRWRSGERCCTQKQERDACSGQRRQSSSGRVLKHTQRFQHRQSAPRGELTAALWPGAVAVVVAMWEVSAVLYFFDQPVPRLTSYLH